MPGSFQLAIAPHTVRPIPADGVLALFREEDWWPERGAEQMSTVIAGGPAVAAWDGDDLIGFARAVTDHVLRAYVEDVIVARDRRGRGIGRALLSCLLDQTRPVPLITLFCSARLVPYYESAGFHATSQVVLHQAPA